MHDAATRVSRKATLLPLIFIFVLVFFSVESSHAAPQVTDVSITDAVSDELSLDHLAPMHMIDVETRRGVVRLSGSVDNLLAKERAARIAGTVKGVRAIVNTIRVEPSNLRSDIDIRADVEEALIVDPVTEGREIKVSVRDNLVTLTGNVDSWQEKELSEKIVMGVNGVKGVNNEIDFTFSDARSDDDIKEDIVKALRWDVLVDHALTDVNVKNGSVELSGIVGSLAEKRQAIGNAYVANVTDVNAEKLEVQRWTRDPKLKGGKYQNLADNDILEAVKDALRYDPRVASSNIQPEIANGVVTIRGTVDNLEAKRAAAWTARHTVGVSRVIDRIKVRPSQSIDDEKLADRVRRAFARDPVLTTTEISLNVRKGAVGLLGSVDSYAKKNRARNLASRVSGVVAVNDYLVVTGAYDPYPYDPWVDNRTIPGVIPHDYHPPMGMLESDREIKEAIEEELFWSPFVESDRIEVSVDNGTATLVGTVGSWAEYNTAADNAYEGGAASVNNELIVRFME